MMLRSLKDLHGYTIHATDGDIGKVDEFYFDDKRWTVRYLVADTGNWLVDRQVLLSTVALGHPDWEKQVFPVALTKEQVENSPLIDANKAVSRQMEEELHAYFGWYPYWSGAAAVAAMVARKKASKDIAHSNPALRSTREVISYHIHAIDGEIGQVEDFIAEDDTWVIRYLVVNTRNLLPGKSVLIAPMWVERVSWATKEVYVNLSTESVKNSPEFDPSAPVNRVYELRLCDYYGRPKYWTQI